LLRLWDSENGFMKIGIKLLALGVELGNPESLKSTIHDMLGHFHSFLDFFEVFTKLFNVLDLVNFEL